MTDESTTPSGEWITPPVSYVEPRRRSCALCGRPIARRYWRAAPAGETLPFCDPAHEALYVSYWLPIHGTTVGGTKASVHESERDSSLRSE